MPKDDKAQEQLVLLNLKLQLYFQWSNRLIGICGKPLKQNHFIVAFYTKTLILTKQLKPKAQQITQKQFKVVNTSAR